MEICRFTKGCFIPRILLEFPNMVHYFCSEDDCMLVSLIIYSFYNDGPINLSQSELLSIGPSPLTSRLFRLRQMAI